MTFSVPSALLFPVETSKRRTGPSKYQEVLSSGLKKGRGQRSSSCTKLPPLNEVDKVSPAISSHPTLASSKTSMRSTSKSSTLISAYDPPANRKDLQSDLPSIQKSRRSSSAARISDSEFFPKLPNLLTVAWQQRPEKKATNHKTTSFAAQGQTKTVKRRNSAANDPFLKFQKKFAPLLEQHDPIQKKLAPLLEQHGTIRKLASEYELKDEANNSVSANFPTGLLDSSSCITSSEQTSPAPANYFGDTVYIQAERFFEAEAEAETAERTSDDASSLTGSTDLCNFDPEEFMPASSPKAVTITGLQNVQPVDMEKKATTDDNSTAPTSSRSTGIDESLEACSIEALVSPVRVKKQTNNRARNFFRGLTVGVNQQFDTNCIPEEKLDNLEKMFKQYDEDSNGQLNVLEFGKFLQDQGMEIEISDLKEAVAMVAPAASPEGRSGIDLNSFKELIAHGLKAEELREEQYCGYSQEDADVLRGVFDAYDANHTGVLEAAEIGNLLEDMGQAPQSLKEQEALRAVLERIVGGTLRPLRFREFLELAKILEKTTIGSGGKSQDHGLDQRRSSDRMEVARKAGLTMADVRQLQEIFTSEAKHGATLSSIDLHQMLKSRLKLYGTDGEREQQVHVTITKHEGAAGSFEFDDFMAVVIDLVVANLATVPALLGEKSTNNFLGHMASLLL